MVIMIYTDDELKYTSETFGKTTEKISFDVDVRNCQKLTIKAGLIDGWSPTSSCCLVDTLLTKSPSAVTKNLNKDDITYIGSASGIEGINIIDTNGFSFSKDFFNDSYGFSYSSYLHIDRIGDGDRYILFGNSGNASSFSGSIVSCQDTGSNEKMVIQIYLDDVLKYTSPTFGKTSEKIDFVIDVSGGKNITIKAGLIDGWSPSAHCALVNLTLK